MKLAALAAAFLAACNSPSRSSSTISTAQAGGSFANAPAVKLQYPVRVAVAQDGTVFTTDAQTGSVVGTKDGAPVVAITGVPRPLGVAVAGDKLYVGSAGRHTVEMYDLTARKAGWAATGLEMPNSIAVAANGDIYVVDSKHDRVVVLGSTGALARTLDAGLNFPVSVAVDADRVVIGDQGNHRVVVLDTAGRFVRAFGSEITSDKSLADYRGRFTSISSVALAGDEILVLDSAHSYVQVFDAAGSPQGFFGYAGDCGSCTKLALDIARTADGRVLATDPEHHRIVTLSTERR